MPEESVCLKEQNSEKPKGFQFEFLSIQIEFSVDETFHLVNT